MSPRARSTFCVFSMLAALVAVSSSVRLRKEASSSRETGTSWTNLSPRVRSAKPFSSVMRAARAGGTTPVVVVAAGASVVVGPGRPTRGWGVRTRVRLPPPLGIPSPRATTPAASIELVRRERSLRARRGARAGTAHTVLHGRRSRPAPTYLMRSARPGLGLGPQAREEGRQARAASPEAMRISTARPGAWGLGLGRRAVRPGQHRRRRCASAQGELVALDVDGHLGALGVAALQKRQGQLVPDFPLDEPA